MGDEQITDSGRIKIGLAAGIVAAAAKGIVSEYPYIMRLVDMDQEGKILSEIYGFFALTVFLMIVGAAAAWWYEKETDRRKLFAIAIAGPAVITTLAGGNFPDFTRGKMLRSGFELSIIQPAGASDMSNADLKTNSGSLIEGIKLVFGIGKDDSQYRVVIGSAKTLELAEAKAKSFKARYPDLPIHVGERRPGNEHYAIVVGEYQAYPSAKALLSRVKELGIVDDAFLSPP